MRKTVRKLLVPIVGGAALSIVLAACGSPVEPFAATVNGTTISSGTLDSTMSAIAHDSGYRCEILGGTASTSTLSIEGSGSGTYSSAFAADVLSELIQYSGAHDAVLALHLNEGAYVRSLAATELPTALTPSSSLGCSTDGALILADFPASFRAALGQFEIDDDVLAAHYARLALSPTGVASYEASHPAVANLDCVSVIEVTSKSIATTAREQIEAGESFASVAKADSKDSSSTKGGALGCLYPSAFTAPLSTDIAALAVGQISQPIAFSTSYLLLTVTSHKTAPVSEALPLIFNDEQSKVTAAIAAATSASHVVLDPQYGTWAHSSSGWAVEPPSGPADALLPSPSAVTPATASLSPS